MSLIFLLRSKKQLICRRPSVRYQSNLTQQITDSINQSKEILDKISKQHKTFWKITSGIVLTGTLCSYMYYDDIQEYLGKRGAIVATTTLEDDNVKKARLNLVKIL